MSDNTRRANPRFVFFADAEVILPDGSCVPAQVDELSARGCYVITVEPIPSNTKVSLGIEHDNGITELYGKVIYVQSGGGLGLFGAGMSFENVTVEQQAAINGWLKSASRKVPQKIFLDQVK